MFLTYRDKNLLQNRLNKVVGHSNIRVRESEAQGLNQGIGRREGGVRVSAHKIKY